MRGYIAYLDILGFSNRIASGNFTVDFKKYTEILEKVLLTEEDELSYITFSDSIVINTETDEESQLYLLASAVSKLTFELLCEMGIPLCGCISVGDFSRHESEGNIMIAGSPILDAVHYEGEQEWIGVMLSPKVIEHFPNIQAITHLSSSTTHRLALGFFNWSSTIQRYSKIPLGDSEYDGFSIIPRNRKSTTIDQWIEDIYDYIYELDKMKLWAPDYHTQKKYNQTRDFLSIISHNWSEYTSKKEWQDFVESIGEVNHFTFGHLPP